MVVAADGLRREWAAARLSGADVVLVLTRQLERGEHLLMSLALRLPAYDVGAVASAVALAVLCVPPVDALLGGLLELAIVCLRGHHAPRP